MGNEWRVDSIDRKRFNCPCKNGYYEKVTTTMSDDYLRTDEEIKYSMECESCKILYTYRSFYGWILKSDNQKLEQQEQLINNELKSPKEYILGKYKDQMVNFLNNKPRTQWYKKWRDVCHYTNTIQTFRKYTNSIEDFLINYGNFYGYRCILEWMGIEDPIVEEEYKIKIDELRDVKRDILNSIEKKAFR